MTKKVFFILCGLFLQFSLPCYAARFNDEHVRAIGSFFPESIDFYWPHQAFEIWNINLWQLHTFSKNGLTLNFSKPASRYYKSNLNMRYSLIPAKEQNRDFKLQCSPNHKRKMASSVGDMDFCVQIKPPTVTEPDIKFIEAKTVFKSNNTRVEFRFDGSEADFSLFLQSLQRKKIDPVPNATWSSLYHTYYPRHTLVTADANYKLTYSNLEWSFLNKTWPAMLNLNFAGQDKLSKTGTHQMNVTVRHKSWQRDLPVNSCPLKFSKRTLNHPQFGPCLVCTRLDQSGFVSVKVVPLNGSPFSHVDIDFNSLPDEIETVFKSLSPMVP